MFEIFDHFDSQELNVFGPNNKNIHKFFFDHFDPKELNVFGPNNTPSSDLRLDLPPEPEPTNGRQ